MRRQSVRNLVCAVITVILVAACAAPGWAERGAGYYIPALLLPGYGQSSDGHFTKGAIIAGVSVAGWIGLFATQLNYNRAVEQYDIAKSVYVGFGDDLSSGTVVRASDIESTYNEMQTAWDSAEQRYTHRNIFVGALIAIYAINAIDILTSQRDTGERGNDEPTVMLDMGPDRVMLIKTFSF